MKLIKLQRPTVKRSIWLIIATMLFLVIFSMAKPSTLLLPVYRSVYMPKTHAAFNEAQNQLGPILSFVDAKPVLKQPLYCYYTAPPRVFYRHFGCTYYISGERVITADTTQLQALDVLSREATEPLRTNGWTATVPASMYGGDWHTISLDKAQTLPWQTDSWVKYVRSFGDIKCVLNIEVRSDRHTSENRQVKAALSCGHTQKLPASTGV